MAQIPQVTRDDVLDAARRIAGHVLRTPLLETEIRGHRVWLKCESLQTGGSFKLRGATNRLLRLNGAERERGVVAFSSGNHAQGVAIAARRLRIPARIVMPSEAPAKKIEGTLAQGAEVIFYDRATEDRVSIAGEIARETGATVVPSFDDADIVAGQGTAGLEILEQLTEAGLEAPANILVCCGGGGLSAGIALACPDSNIVIVEPEGWDDMTKSLDIGHIVPVSANPPLTRCDALQTPLVSPITFGVLSDRRAKGVAVSEDEVRTAVRWAWHHHQLVVEPGGAVALAAMLAGKADLVERTVALLSGGNIDPALHAELVA